MATGRGSITFLFDANLSPRLSGALQLLGESAVHVQDVLRRGVPDEVWLEYAGERGWCTVSQDRRILKRPHERAALTKFGVGAFFLVETHQSFCDTVQTLIKNWPEMKRIAATPDRPFVREVRRRGIKPLR